MHIAASIAIGLVVATATLDWHARLGRRRSVAAYLDFRPEGSPILAVGSDALFNSMTKIGSRWVHSKKGTVHRRAVLAPGDWKRPGLHYGSEFSRTPPKHLRK